MLPRRQRLTVADFNKVFEQGRVLRHPLLQVRVLERNNEKDGVRAAFVAPKKLGKATVRNRLRRRVRERFRLLQTEYSHLLRDCDLVWIIGEATAGANGTQIDGALRELLKRAGRHLGKCVDTSVDKNKLDKKLQEKPE